MTLNKKWIVIIASGSLVMLTLIIGLIIHINFFRDICSEDVCLSSECVQSAAEILDYIDDAVKPCDNFYRFVCGGFLRNAEIADDMNEVSTTSVLNDNLQKQLKGALEEPMEIDELKSFKSLKTFYAACMNTEDIERQGVGVVRTLLKDMGWPVMEDKRWETKDLDWYHYIYRFKQVGLDTNQILHVDIQKDLKNSTYHILQIDQPEFALPRSFLIDEIQNEFVEEYRRYMVNVAVYLGANEFKATFQLRDALKFEMNLSRISLSNEARTNVSDFYNVLTIKELQDHYPSVPWLDYMNNLLTPHYQVTTQERVLVLVPSYLRDLDELLKATSKRNQVNYLVWKAISTLIPYLSEDLREMEFRFKSVTSGIQQKLPRWNECLEKTYKSFPIALSALYVRRFFDDEIKIGAERLIEYVKDEYASALEKLKWMDKRTKKSAMDKANALKSVVGYPEELLDDNKLEEIYGSIEVHPKEFLRSFFNITLILESLKFKQLRTLKGKWLWMDHSAVAEVDAFYTPLTNTIMIPAGILQGAYYNPTRPNYMNFGGIGFAIGHEITHAFDNTGRLFDKRGNLANWWEKETESSYLEKVQCIVDQYNDFLVEEVNQTINGITTQDDNIADTVGVQRAYAAYIRWTEDSNQEKKLPGLPYTPNQLFWISFAMTQCSKQRPEHLTLKMSSDFHSPPEFRVLGPLQNSKEFAFDFDCAEDADMHPADKCSVW